MSNIYVPIRAFGDFTITTAVIKNHFSGKLDIILPDYLRELYDVLDGDEYYNIVDVIDINRSPAFFELHKIKSARDLLRLTREVIAINKHLKRQHKHLFDYRNRRLNIFFKDFIYPESTGNIYQSKIRLLERFLEKRDAKQIINADSYNVKKAIIFPGSRKRSKVVDAELVKKIMGSGMFNTIDIAYHKDEHPLDGAIIFNDFKGLKSLVLAHDLIISADSLPLHLAYFFNKAHFGIYNECLNEQWLTPYVEDRKYYTVYAGNADVAFGDIKNKLA
jgi:ADP-heptose:LPS heptosyltransferase